MKLKCFGIARELIGASELELEGPRTVAEVRSWLREHHAAMNTKSYLIAVNEEYAQDDQVLKQDDVLAVIPPVSGG